MANTTHSKSAYLEKSPRNSTTKSKITSATAPTTQCHKVVRAPQKPSLYYCKFIYLMLLYVILSLSAAPKASLDKRSIWLRGQAKWLTLSSMVWSCQRKPSTGACMNIFRKRRNALLGLSAMVIAAMISFSVMTARAGHLPFLVTIDEATVIHPEKVDHFCGNAMKIQGLTQDDQAAIAQLCRDAHGRLEFYDSQGCTDSLDAVAGNAYD